MRLLAFLAMLILGIKLCDSHTLSNSMGSNPSIPATHSTVWEIFTFGKKFTFLIFVIKLLCFKMIGLDIKICYVKYIEMSMLKIVLEWFLTLEN